MKEKMYHVALDDYEHGIVLRSLNDERNNLIAQGRSSDAVDDVLIKVGTAPQKKVKIIERDRDER